MLTNPKRFIALECTAFTVPSLMFSFFAIAR